MLIQTLCILSVFIHHIPTEQQLDTKHFIFGNLHLDGQRHLKQNWLQTPPLSYLRLMATFLPDAQAKTLEFSLAPLPLTPYVQSLCRPSTSPPSNPMLRNFPAVQWLRLPTSTAGGAGSILGWGRKIVHAHAVRPKK